MTAPLATYDYVDEGGQLLFQVLRYPDKTFRQRRPDNNGGWVWNLQGVRRVLFRLPRVLEAVRRGDPVYIPEGEKDVLALEVVGAVATTNPGGTGSTKRWREGLAEPLAGAKAIVVADRDEPGRRHAREVAAALEAIATEVAVVEPVEGKDAFDHLMAGHGLDEFVALEPALDELPPLSDEARARIIEPVVRFDDSKPPKLILPPLPDIGDIAGLCAWLTAVLNLDPAHPIVGAVHQGVRGPQGHVELRRADALPIRFEPASTLNTARKLLDTLSWHLLPTDGEPYGYKDEHARHITHAVQILCGTSNRLTAEQETASIVGTFQYGAVAVEGQTTYGEGNVRYEAAAALQRNLDGVSGRAVGPPRYLVDSNTGELVIRVSDLAAAARAHTGASLQRGWLDARMEALGFERVTLEGHALPGRAGRQGPHARADVYRGDLPNPVVTVVTDAEVST